MIYSFLLSEKSTYILISRKKQPDGSAIWNTNINLNTAIGTAILGLILLGTINVIQTVKLVLGIKYNQEIFGKLGIQ